MATIYYNTEELVKAIEKELDRDTAILAAWRAVTYPTKKDGSQFAVLSKNIAGATVEQWRCATQPGENVVTVYTHTAANGYIHDTVYAYCLIKDIKDGDPKKEKISKNACPKITYLEQVYTYDTDDIKNAIDTRIAYLEKTIKDKRKQIKAAQKAFETFKKDYQAIRERLEKNSVFENNNRTLFSMILNSVQKNY